MRRLLIITGGLLALTACGVSSDHQSDPAAAREAAATSTAMDAADREVGMPRMMNFAQKKLLKNAYEDMDQTTLTYVYTQALDGRFVCLGQAIGYGVSLGTQFTAEAYPKLVNVSGYNSRENGIGGGGVYMLQQPEPNGLYSPSSGAATIVDLINPANGEAHTAIMEPNIVTVPFELPPSSVAVACPADVDPTRVRDVKESSAATQLK